MNSLFTIAPYKFHGMWVFDDPDHGLVREPFVAGADLLIDRMVEQVPYADDGFILIFSANPFPGQQSVLVRSNKQNDGTWYYDATTLERGWLCPALFKYFAEAPQFIHVQVKELK